MLIEEAKANIRHAVETDRIAHAYLIVGSPRGAAAELAIYIMQLLACKEHNAPCGTCDTCRQIKDKIWCDAFWLMPMKKSRIISVDQMRRGDDSNKIKPPYFLTFLSETSLLGGWKFGIATGADRMTEQAANALLKTLEEPPPKTMLLLLTDAPQQLLPTIRSRCATIQLVEQPPELDEKYFEPLVDTLSNSISKGPLAASAMAARIEDILGQIEADAKKEAKDSFKNDEEIDLEDDQEEAIIRSLFLERRALLVQTMLRWYRDILAIVSNAGDEVIHYQDYLDTLHKRANGITLAQAIANVEAIEEMNRQLDRSIGTGTVLQYWLDRIVVGTEK